MEYVGTNRHEERTSTGSEPLFSIVTVTLNCREDAVITAESVKGQEYSSYEYVIKDGGSSDNTIDKLRDLGHNVVVQQDNGIYDAMNQALAICRGRYVCFLNAGDLFFDSKTLASVALVLEDEKFPVFAYGDVRLLFKHRILQEPVRNVIYRSHLSAFYLYRKMICHQAWFVKREVLVSRGGFDTNLRILGDYDMLLHLIMKMRVSHFHIPFITAVYKGFGISDNSGELLASERNIVLTRYYSKIQLGICINIIKPLWEISKRIGYSMYFFVPIAMRKRLEGL